MPRTLFRIVNTNPPGLDDFKSYAELGQRPFRDNPDLNRLATGLSMFDTLDAARAKGMGKPWRSRGFVAELSLPDDDAITIEKTTRDPDQFAVWAEAATIQASVIRVFPIVKGPDDV